jgi:arsenate reductase (thioredoxin)
MAQGFANYYGKGWLLAESAGTGPAGIISPKSIEVMAEKGIDISFLPSQGVGNFRSVHFDYIIVLEPSLAPRVKPLLGTTHFLSWDIPDPIGKPVEVFRDVRDQIELKVLDLVDSIQKED